MAHDHNIHKEQELGKVYDSRLMKRLIKYLKPYIGKVVVAFIFLVLASIIGLAGPWIIKVGIDEYIAKDRIDELWIIAAIYLAVLISHFIVQYSQVYLLQDVAQSAMKDLRRDIFSHMQKLPVRYFDRNPIGRLVTRVVNDVDVLNQMFAAGIVTIIGDILTLSGIIVVLLLMDVRLALITYTVLPVMLGGMLLFKIKARQAFRKIRTRIAAINSFMQERVGGMSIVQVFTQEKKSFQQFAKANWKHTEANLEAVLYYSIFFPATSIVLSLATALILWFGGGEIIKGAISFGVLVAFAQYAERFFRPIADLSEKYNVLQQAMASGERIFQLLDSEPEHEAKKEEQLSVEKIAGRN
jgi:ATP-binding cassette subfamily B multidrug efflux pump